MSRVLNYSTPEGTLVRNTATGKVWTVLYDFPHKKVLKSAKGTELHVTTEFFPNWVEVEAYIDFTATCDIVYQ